MARPKDVAETWGLKVDGRILQHGYSDRPLRSADDVRKDFDRALVERGEVVLLARIITRYEVA